VVPGVAPVTEPDIHVIENGGQVAAVGLPYNVNVLANDFLGDPPGSINFDDLVPLGPCTGFSFDRATGLLSGTPTVLGDCVFQYVVVNSVGGDGTTVQVEVHELAAPNAFSDSAQATAGEPFSLNVFDNLDELGIPQATITADTFSDGGACAGLTFDSATGLLSGTPVGLGTPTGDVCDFDYTLSNPAGTDTAAVTVTIFPGPIAPNADDDTEQVNEGESFFMDLLFNDFLGHPQAEITSDTFATATGCEGVEFNRTFGFVASTGQASADLSCSFTYTISNSSGTSTATVSVEVVTPPTTTSTTTTTTPPTTSSTTTSTTSTTTTSTTTTTTVNQDPIAEPDGAEMSKTESNVVGNVLANDDDPDGDVLVVTTAGTFTLTYGVLVLGANGAFTYTLDQSNPDVVALGPDEALTDVFEYDISDGRGGTSTGLLLIVING
jgi:VCBS repeat-containing protein